VDVVRVTSGKMLSSWLPEYAFLLYFWSFGSTPGPKEVQTFKKLVGIWSKQLDGWGPLHFTKWLKATAVYIGHFISGKPSSDPLLFGQKMLLDKHGLPNYLPIEIRHRLISGDIRYMRFLISLIYVYKGLYFDPVEKQYHAALEQITSPSDISEDHVINVASEGREGFLRFLSTFSGEGDRQTLLREFRSLSTGQVSDTVTTEQMEDELGTKRAFPFVIEKSGPNGRPSIGGLILDIYYHSKTNYINLSRYLYTVGVTLGTSVLYGFAGPLLHKALDLVKGFKYRPRGGTLSFKVESAGKIRVFAILDQLTQWALRPLHLSIFQVLKLLPTDCTFDHSKGVKRLQALRKKCHNYFCSLDLTSATDRIPSVLYPYVLDLIFEHQGSFSSWRTLLIDRDYNVPTVKGLKEPLPKTVRYAVGQPMGVLSSWAGLALVHHYLVHLAAYRVGYNTSNGPIFTDYQILGDDLVIANFAVAEEYKQVLAELGIPLSLPKSFESSNGFFEFASQIVLGDENISPIQLKEVLAARSPHKRTMFAQRVASRWFARCVGIFPYLRVAYGPLRYRRLIEHIHSSGPLPVEVAVELGFLLAPSGNLLRAVYDKYTDAAWAPQKTKEIAIMIFTSVLNRSKGFFSYPGRVLHDSEQLSDPNSRIVIRELSGWTVSFQDMLAHLKRLITLSEKKVLETFVSRAESHGFLFGEKPDTNTPLDKAVLRDFDNLLKNGPEMPTVSSFRSPDQWWSRFKVELKNQLSIGLFQEFLRKSAFSPRPAQGYKVSGIFEEIADLYGTAWLSSVSKTFKLYPGEFLPARIDAVKRQKFDATNRVLFSDEPQALFDLWQFLVQRHKSAKLLRSFIDPKDFGFNSRFSEGELLEALWVRTFRRSLRENISKTIKDL
jgi:hypothetical protein